MRWRVEIASTTIGWATVESDMGETPGDVRHRARCMVEECEIIPVWTDDVTVRTMRMYDANGECEQQVGSATPYCQTHQEPMVKGLDVCLRRAEDVALRIDPDQERLW